jgi:hypothetical protein
MMRSLSRERRKGRAWPALDDAASRRSPRGESVSVYRSSASAEEERGLDARPSASEKAKET